MDHGALSLLALINYELTSNPSGDPPLRRSISVCNSEWEYSALKLISLSHLAHTGEKPSKCKACDYSVTKNTR